MSSASESKSHDGVTKGSYSYVDGYGHVQSVSYTADPHTGFHAVGTNLPQAPHAVGHGHFDHGHYASPVHISPHGLPVDTPEVAHAKAQHLAAHAAAKAQAHGHHHLYKRAIYGSAPWSYPQHVPVIHNGVPVEPPEVQEAKAAHFAAHAHANGAPSDTPEVQHAKSQHFAAHAAAARSAHPGYGSAPSYHNPAPAYHNPAPAYHQAPSYHNNHVPQDTPEVAQAKSQHYAALARAGPGPNHSPDYHHQPAPYQGPIHIPVIQNGVPVEPEEVQHARSAHLNALASAASHSSHSHNPAPYDGNYGPNHYDDGSYRPEYEHYTN